MSPEDQALPRCPYCLAALQGGYPRESVVSCVLCLTRLHRACYREHGRCTTFGCEGVETTTDVVAERRPGWELHPFLPLEEAGLRPPSFLTVQQQEQRGPERKKSLLRLELPSQAHCGRALEGKLDVFVPRALHGWGIRLEIEARVRIEDEEEALVLREEAVLSGKPRRGWLEKLKLWSREPEPLLLHGGLTRFRFGFDPGRLHWGGTLPMDEALGPWHTLSVRAVIDASGLPKETRQHRVLVIHPHRRCGTPLRGS